jgi:hypothetical protein
VAAPNANDASKLALVAIVLAAVAVGAILVIVVPKLQTGVTGGGNSTTYPPIGGLPAGCTRPAGGYLIIANENGYNDSIQHGAPEVQWPVILVKEGAQVNITVCNADLQPHGFQITHYFDSNIETVTPGKVVHVSFLANKPGDFMIYCSIFCTIHPFMQNGLFRVTA